MINGPMLIRGASLVAALVLWQAAVMIFEPDLLPAPTRVLARLVQEFQSGQLPTHLAVTLSRVATSFVLAMALGLLLGALMGRFPKVDASLDGLLTVALNLPALVVIILSLLWFGLNEFAIVLAVVLNKTPTMMVVFREGVRAVDQSLMEVARVHQLSRWRQFAGVWLPQLYPYFLAATRSGLALVWKIVLVVELLGASQGMGFKLGEFFQFFEIDGVLAYACAFIVFIMLLEALIIRPWEARVMRWRAP